MLKLELKKIISRKEFVIFFFLMFFAVISDFLINCWCYYGSNMSALYTASNMTVLNNVSRSPFRTVYVILLPIVACIMASDTYLVDKKMGMNNYILLRTDRKKYIWTKGVAIFILVSLTILINILLSISLAYIAFPAYGYCSNGRVSLDILSGKFISKRLFIELYMYHPYINLLVFGFIRALTGGVYALLAYGISFFKNSNRYIVMASSFLIVTVLEIIEEIYKNILEKIGVNDGILRKIGIFGTLLNTNIDVSFLTYIKEFFLFLGVALILIYAGTKREEL